MPARKIVSWVAVILWMVIIFNLSAQVAEQSDQLSTGITEFIMNAIEKFAGNINVDIGSFNHLVRKNAHFIAYFVLGVLAANALGRSGLHGYKSILSALLICILYAVSDEVHQLFVPGRAGQVKDVIIDNAGASVGIGVYLMFVKFNRRRRNHTG